MTKQQTQVKEINAAILARISDPSQKYNSSLDGQLNTCREYCAQQGYNIVIDKKEMMSGVFVLARSVFTELLDMAANGLIQVIVVDIPDRLGRGKARSKLEYMAELNGARVEAVLTPEQEETLQHFQHEIASRMTDDVPAVDRMQLYDILRVQCVYNSETDELLITGLFGETTVREIDKQSRIR